MRKLGLIVASLALTAVIGCAAPVDTGTGHSAAADAPPEAPGDTVTLVPAGEDVRMTIPNPAPLVHTWSEAIVVGADVHLPHSDVERCGHVHIDLCDSAVTCDAVLCWMTAKVLLVGEALCPSCDTGSLSCDGRVLGCDTCYEEFELETGSSVSGDSQPLRVTPVPVAVVGDVVAVAIEDVLSAAGETLQTQVSSVPAQSEDEKPEQIEACEYQDESESDLPSCCA